MKQNLLVSYENYIVQFRTTIKSLGLNNSVQREYVLKTFFNSNFHLNAEEILFKVKDEYRLTMGIATVYRILHLLEEMKVIGSISVDGNGSKVYELNLVHHHDHIVCTGCGKIVEFINEEIERLQELMAKQNNFKLLTHNMMLYGVCQDCQFEEKR